MDMQRNTKDQISEHERDQVIIALSLSLLRTVVPQRKYEEKEER